MEEFVSSESLTSEETTRTNNKKQLLKPVKTKTVSKKTSTKGKKATTKKSKTTTNTIAKKAIEFTESKEEETDEPDEGLGLLPEKNIEDDDHSEWIYQEGEKKLALEDESALEEVEFIAKADKKTVSDEEQNMSMVRAYKKEHITNIPYYRYTDKSEKHEFHEYPMTCDDPCAVCHDLFDTVPVYPVIDYDQKRNCYVLSIFAVCGVLCETISIVTDGGANQGKRLQLAARRNREYFGIKGPVPYIALSARKRFSKFGHLDDEQWAKAAGRVSCVIKMPPFYFVETWIEETDMEKKASSRNKQIVASHMIKATAEQQENYLLNSERVMQEFQTKRQSIENTKIGRKLGIIAKKN